MYTATGKRAWEGTSRAHVGAAHASSTKVELVDVCFTGCLCLSHPHVTIAVAPITIIIIILFFIVLCVCCAIIVFCLHCRCIWSRRTRGGNAATASWNKWLRVWGRVTCGSTVASTRAAFTPCSVLSTSQHCGRLRKHVEAAGVTPNLAVVSGGNCCIHAAVSSGSTTVGIEHDCVGASTAVIGHTAARRWCSSSSVDSFG